MRPTDGECAKSGKATAEEPNLTVEGLEELLGSRPEATSRRVGPAGAERALLPEWVGRLAGDREGAAA